MKHVNLEKWKEPVEKLTKMLTENSPTILTVFGSVGLVTTVGLAIRATVSAARIMDLEVLCSSYYCWWGKSWLYYWSK